MLFFTLFWIFARIGLFTVGGGLAMLPLVSQAMLERGWMTPAETADMVAISQMTPGPFAVNAATFTGMRLGGVPGAAMATLGVMAPSLVLVTLAARWFFGFRDSRAVQGALKGVRPVVPALVAASVWMLSRASFWPEAGAAFSPPFLLLPLIALVSLLLVWRVKLNPVWAILAGGAIGAVFFR